MNEPDTIYVFGRFSGPGHHLHHPSGHIATMAAGVEAACDGLLRSGRGEEPEGQSVRAWQRATPVPAGWSFVSWWDRQGDPRGGSHTGILAPGTWTDEQLIAAGRRLAPWAFRVEVR